MLTIKTGSENTVKAFEFLKANQDGVFTIKEVAEALGLTSAKVTGGLVSLEKKGAVTKEEVERDGKPYKGYSFAEDVEFVMNETKAISDKAVRLLQYLQAHDGQDLTAADVAEEFEVMTIAINGVVNGLVKRGLLVREEALVEMPDGETKTIKFIVLTDAGRNYKF